MPPRRPIPDRPCVAHITDVRHKPRADNIAQTAHELRKIKLNRLAVSLQPRPLIRNLHTSNNTHTLMLPAQKENLTHNHQNFHTDGAMPRWARVTSRR